MPSPYYNTTHSGPNPLRPYYAPNSEVVFDPTSSSAINTTVQSSYGVFSDLPDYSDYVRSPSFSEAARGMVDGQIMDYTRVLISQPFEVAKTVLQCQVIPRNDKAGELKSKRTQHQEDFARQYGTSDSDYSDEDEPNYFSNDYDSRPSSPDIDPLQPAAARGTRKTTDRAGYVLEAPGAQEIPRPDWQIRQVSHVTEVLKALWEKEGVFGVWKGQNASFFYSFAFSSLETLTKNFLSAIMGLPDPAFTPEVVDSTNPVMTLGCVVAASTLTAIVLAPLDTIRTKLMVTSRSSNTRGLIHSLRTLPTYFIHPSLILPTILSASIPSAIHLVTPYLLKTRFNLDPVLTPTTFNLFSFFSSTVELAVRLPLETILRRAQVSVTNPERTIVPVGRYAGVAGTAWVVVKEEKCLGKTGLEGLYRGWKVGWWGNLGVLGLRLLGVQHANAGEF